MSPFEFERPEELLRRLKVGREEAMQRMLTSLILRGPYPKWNSPSQPSAQGIDFVRTMYEHCFGAPWPGDECTFVDEYELRGRSNAEKGGAPDWAVLWPDRAWLIELKSERASHRAAQIPMYFTLGRHHHPDCAIDITYLTPKMSAPHTTANPWERYAHLSWDDVIAMVRTAWPHPSSASEAAVVDGIIQAIEQLQLKPRAWREGVVGKSDREDHTSEAAAVPSQEATVESNDSRFDTDVIEQALALAKATGGDGKQRALDVRFDSLDSLLETRLLVRERISLEPSDASVRFVMVWRWREETTGRALTAAGRSTGYEIRFSKYGTLQV